MIDDKVDFASRALIRAARDPDRLAMMPREDGTTPGIDNSILGPLEALHRGYAHKAARDYASMYGRLEDLHLIEDLAQAALVGMLRAAEKYDFDRGAKFLTYAAWYMEQAAQRELVDAGMVIRVPVYMHRIAAVREDGVEAECDRPELRDRARAAMSCRAVGASSPARDLDGFDYMEHLADRSATATPGPPSGWPRAEAALEELTAREREIIARRAGLGGGEPETLGSIGRDLKISKERVRQIEDRALVRLQLKLGARAGGGGFGHKAACKDSPAPATCPAHPDEPLAGRGGTRCYRCRPMKRRATASAG